MSLLGVASGNLHTIGWLKLERSSPRPFFRFAGFSDGYEYRSDVFRAAVEEVRRRTHPGASICVVGDKPSDIQAARDNDLDVICRRLRARSPLSHPETGGSAIERADSAEFVSPHYPAQTADISGGKTLQETARCRTSLREHRAGTSTSCETRSPIRLLPLRNVPVPDRAHRCRSQARAPLLAWLPLQAMRSCPRHSFV
jgi:hypothetical protein